MRTLPARLHTERPTRKAQARMQRAAEKPHKNKDAERRREQDEIPELPQTDESSIRNLRRLRMSR